MVHVIIIADASSSISNRAMEEFKETLIGLLPPDGFRCTILTFDNKVTVVGMHQTYKPTLIEKMACGMGLSNLYMAIEEGYAIANKNKESTILFYIGDGNATDWTDTPPNSPNNIKHKIALIIGGDPSNAILSDFVKYRKSDASLNQIKNNLAILIK